MRKFKKYVFILLVFIITTNLGGCSGKADVLNLNNLKKTENVDTDDETILFLSLAFSSYVEILYLINTKRHIFNLNLNICTPKISIA